MSTLAILTGQLRAEMRKDPSGRIQSDSILTRNLNKAVENICTANNYNFYFCDGDFYTLTSIGTRDYAFPADFVRVEEGTVRYGQRALSYSDYRVLKRNEPSLFTTGRPTTYYFRNGSLCLFPCPSEELELEYAYRKGPTPMSLPDDECFFPDDFNKAIILYAAYLCFRDYDKNSALSALQDFNQEMVNINSKYTVIDENGYNFSFETINKY